MPKLSDRVINGELLRHLAKTANDDQPGIRTNTTICLGKIAKNLGTSSRTKVLVAAFTRSLRDPFFHARNAALMALSATSDLFTEDDCAIKLLPAICPSLLDKEKVVRDQANKTLDQFIQRVRKHAQSMPDTVLPPPEAATTNTPRMSTPQNDSSWAGWAISSFTNKLATASGDMQPTKNGLTSPPASRSSSVPPGQAQPSLLATTKSRPPAITTPSAPAMSRLSASRPESPAPVAEEEDFGEDWGAMNEEEVADAWADPDEADRKAAEQKASTKSGPASYDDQGEPDFEGWLNAQAQAKKQIKSPLPKGLAKKATMAAAAARPLPSRSASAAPKIVASKPVSKQAVTSKPTTPATPAPEEDDDWGEAWG